MFDFRYADKFLAFSSSNETFCNMFGEKRKMYSLDINILNAFLFPDLITYAGIF